MCIPRKSKLSESFAKSNTLARSLTKSIKKMELESNSLAINSSNKGFQLLKKCGWTEGTGLGASQQGRLQPLQPHLKNNKRGLGAEKIKPKTQKLPQESSSKAQNNNEHTKSSKKAKALSKRLRKMQAAEEQLQEKEFEQAFFREFWPENV